MGGEAEDVRQAKEGRRRHLGDFAALVRRQRERDGCSAITGSIIVRSGDITASEGWPLTLDLAVRVLFVLDPLDSLEALDDFVRQFCL